MLCDTAEKFIGGVVDTSEQFSAVSLTPEINFRLFGYFWPVSLTPGKMLSPVSDRPPIKFSTAINCIDDRGLFLLQNYLRPPKSATAADIVIGTAWKRARAPHIPWSEALEATKTSNQNGII